MSKISISQFLWKGFSITISIRKNFWKLFLKRLFQKLSFFPWELLWIIVILCLTSIVHLYGLSGGNGRLWALPQAIRCLVGFTLLWFLSFVSIRTYKRYAYPFYGVVCMLLAMVFLLGTVGMGAKRWISLLGITFQPSELMKISVILFLARYFDDKKYLSLFNVIFSLIVILIPVFFILKQPDLGTALILVFLVLTILWAIGTPLSFFLWGGSALAGCAPLLWTWLHDYQKKRILVFLNPEEDTLKSGYHILQSKISLGSGQWLGKGFMQGTHNQLNFLPAKQTDFIFTTFGEDFGFVGCLCLLALYGAALITGFRLIRKASSFFTYIVCIGVNGLLFFHVAINVGMVMGLLPVVGVPLVFMSYGGSSMVTMFIGYGILIACHVQERMENERRCFVAFKNARFNLLKKRLGGHGRSE